MRGSEARLRPRRIDRARRGDGLAPLFFVFRGPPTKAHGMSGMVEDLSQKSRENGGDGNVAGIVV